MPNNCSFIGVNLKEEKDQMGEFKDLSFVLEFPNIEEDIWKEKNDKLIWLNKKYKNMRCLFLILTKK